MKTSVKKFAVILVLSLVAIGVYAQESSKDEDLFYMNVPIINVYDHIDAYVVNYARGSIGTGNVYLPKEWFKTSRKEDKCRVRPMPKGMKPYMTVIYNHGTILKVYLTMPSNHREDGWKVLSKNIDISDKLVSEPSELEFKF